MYAKKSERLYDLYKRYASWEDVPEKEKQYFHHGWSAMLVIAFIEAVTVFLKIASTKSRKFLKNAVLQKLEGNIGVLFGEYLVVAFTYIIMGADLIVTFLGCADCAKAWKHTKKVTI